jgi:hypothetical protein
LKWKYKTAIQSQKKSEQKAFFILNVDGQTENDEETFKKTTEWIVKATWIEEFLFVLGDPWQKRRTWWLVLLLVVLLTVLGNNSLLHENLPF